MNTVSKYPIEPQEQYLPLFEYVSFEKFSFDYKNYQEQEVSVLQPQLEALGYTDVTWLPGEYDTWGPLTRVCRAKNSYGETKWFIYG